MTERALCTAKSSRTGKPCKKLPIRGGYVCRTHGGSAPQVRQKANRRLEAMLHDALDPNRTLREVGCLAYSDIRDLFDYEGKLLPTKDWPEEIARAVAGVEVVRGNVDKGDGKFDSVVKVRMRSKEGPLHDLMTMHGQLTEKVEVTLNASVEARLVEGRKRVADARRSGQLAG